MRLEVFVRESGWQPMVLEDLQATLELLRFGFKIGIANLYRGTPLGR